MEEKDLKQIGEVVGKAVSKGLGEFWEGNLEPALNELHESQKIMQTKLDKALYHEIDGLAKRVKVIETKLGIEA